MLTDRVMNFEDNSKINKNHDHLNWHDAYGVERLI